MNISAWLERPTGERTPIHGACFVGRSATSTLMLADDRVSRRHAIIQAQGENEHWLIDLGSANGTYVNGRRISQAHRLADKDQIKIGGFSLTFRKPASQHPGREFTTTTDKTVQDIKTVNCWLLVADIEGSTQMIKRLPPEEAPRLTARWLADCKQLLEENGGIVNKFLGDGFFAYWLDTPGLATTVRRALGLLQTLQEKEQPRFRIVAHYGAVIIGGSASLGEESLLGNEVNFVFRMEKLAGSLGILRLLSEPAHTQLKSLLTTTDEGPHEVPSFDGAFQFFSF